MYTATGFLSGLPYTIEVGGPDQPLEGSAHVLALLRLRDGQPWRATPTGPSGRLDAKDPASVLGALLGWTEVRTLDGDVPLVNGWDVHERRAPGTVY